MKLQTPIRNRNPEVIDDTEYGNVTISLSISERIIDDVVETSASINLMPYSDTFKKLDTQTSSLIIGSGTIDTDGQVLVAEIKQAVEKFLMAKGL